jgi:hypothetical protein
MKPIELAQRCIDEINRYGESGHNDLGVTVYVLAGNPNSAYRYPFGRKGPRAKILQWDTPAGYDTVQFDALDLLAYLTANGVCEIVGVDGNAVTMKMTEREDE